MQDSTLGDRLASIRRRRGLTQRELASRSGVSYSLIRQVERGERETTRLETARKLAVPLGVQTSVLLSGGDADEAFADTVADWAPVTGALFAAPDDEDEVGLSASAVRATIGELRPMLEACRYGDATALLPALLRDARALTKDGAFGFAVSEPDAFMVFARSKGAQYLDARGQLDLNNAGMKNAFAQYVALVSKEKVAPLLPDASRLARNGRNWHHLIELCGVVDARVIDLDGVYNPCRPNDRKRCSTALLQ